MSLHARAAAAFVADDGHDDHSNSSTAPTQRLLRGRAASEPHPGPANDDDSDYKLDAVKQGPPPSRRFWHFVAFLSTCLLLGWWTIASLRTEFSFLQQVSCQSALWTDDRVPIIEPLRLPMATPPSGHTLRLRSGVDADTATATTPTAGVDVDVDACQPRTLDASTIAYPSHHPFYEQLRLRQRSSLPPPPRFSGAHASLCNEFRAPYVGWDYCLPVTGRKDEPFCAHTDRSDLLSLRSGARPCFGSALHMVLVDVYQSLERLGARPAVLFGTLLGAVRNGTTIPFTEDADVGYVCHSELSLASVREALRVQGYHMFFQGVWRVCVAPIHPLAPVLYDAAMTTTRKHKVPYVDLYAMSPDGADAWYIDKMEHDRRVPQNKFEPYTHVTLNGMAFATVADPVDFLVHEYGDQYMVPTPRNATR